MNRIASKLMASTLAAGLVLAGGSAYAADLGLDPMEPPDDGGTYVSVFGGYAFGTTVSGYSTQSSFDLSIPLDAGYVIGGAVGVVVAPSMRGELELSYISHAADGAVFASGAGTGTVTGSTGTLYLLGNLWFDLDMGSNFTPYVGGGLGVASIMPDMVIDSAATYDTSALSLAGQLGIGIKVAVSENMTLDLGYRIKDVFGATLVSNDGGSDVTGVTFIDQTIQVGLDVGF